MPKDRRIIVIARERTFDEAAWRRLLIAYAYALQEKQRRASEQGDSGGGEGTV